jgi:hypothetical protein
MCLKREREKGELDRRLDNYKHEGSRGLNRWETDRRRRKLKGRNVVKPIPKILNP